MSKQSYKDCKYGYERWCVERGFNQRDRTACKDCPLYIEECDDCQCTMIYCEDCPYYEPAEEVNNAR